MEPPIDNNARANPASALPREQLARSVFQMPAMWVGTIVLLILLGAVGREFWKTSVGWRRDAPSKVERLYSFLSSGKRLKDAPQEWFSGAGGFDKNLDVKSGPVTGYTFFGQTDEGDDEEAVELSVRRANRPPGREIVYVDRSGLIVRIETM